MKIVVNLQSVVISIPEKDRADVLEHGDFAEVYAKTLQAVSKQLKAGGGIESVEEL